MRTKYVHYDAYRMDEKFRAYFERLIMNVKVKMWVKNTEEKFDKNLQNAPKKYTYD